MEEIWYKSSVDGRDVQGWIVKPPFFEEGQSYPLVVENHGGPISNYGDRFSPEIPTQEVRSYRQGCRPGRELKTYTAGPGRGEIRKHAEPGEIGRRAGRVRLGGACLEGQPQ